MTDLEAVWLAARTLEDPFAREDLAVAAWRMFPERFGLAGYDLPDAGHVFARMAPLLERGYLQPSDDPERPYAVVRHRKQWRGMRRDAFDKTRAYR
jgi:hypothetical protein